MQKLHLSFDKPEKKRKRDRAFSISEIELSILLHNPLTPNYHFASFQSLPPPQHFQLKMYRHFQLDYVYTAPCTQAERESSFRSSGQSAAPHIYPVQADFPLRAREEGLGSSAISSRFKLIAGQASVVFSFQWKQRIRLNNS